MSTHQRGLDRGGSANGQHDNNGRESIDIGKEIGETVEPLIPWAVSVLFHAGILLLACFIVWTAANNEIDEEPVIPNTNLNKNLHARVNMMNPTTITQTRQSDSNTPRDFFETHHGGGPGSSKREAANFGIGDSGKGEAGKGRGDSGSDFGVIGIKGDGKGHDTPFKIGESGASEFKTRFMECDGNGRRVIYLIDASGSLIDTLPFVLMELKRSIDALSEKHEFTVIFFHGSEPFEVPGGKGLRQATALNKRQVTTWIDPIAGNVVPAGLSNPLNAMRLALSYKPQLIYLLSDNITGQGRYEVDQRQLLREIANANRSMTKINAIQYLRPDPLLRAGMPGTMQLIANQMGGVYKYMGARELNIQ
jgi:hypothetical protein